MNRVVEKLPQNWFITFREFSNLHVFTYARLWPPLAPRLKRRPHRDIIDETAGTGPAATSFFLPGSMTRLRPSNVRAPRSWRSSGLAETTSSMVKYLSQMMANPTLPVTCWPSREQNSGFSSRVGYGFFPASTWGPTCTQFRTYRELRYHHRPSPVDRILDLAPGAKRSHHRSSLSSVKDHARR
jgi:hypothetical protein